MEQNQTISPDLVERFKKSYDGDRMAQILTAATAKTVISDLAYLPMNAAKLEDSFSLDLKTRKVTNQKQSGRCWLFAAMNILRESIANKCKIKEFELSGNYLAFWDKLEKCNHFLERIIDTADRDLQDREVDGLVRNGIRDGGYWQMAVALIKKYGIVPYTVMPDTFQSSGTAKLLQMLNAKLRKDACELRELMQAGQNPRPRKEEMLEELFRALCICFGRPVDRFDFEYTDQDGVYHADYGLTPQTFLEQYVDVDLTDYVSLTNEPTSNKPMGLHYALTYTCSVECVVDCLNQPMEVLKDLMLRQMQGGEPVWFACDSSQYGDRALGIWDQNSFDYGGILGGLDLTMTKQQRLEYHESHATHAMVMVGVNLDAQGKPNRWKIENSWGEANGRKGYYVCSDAWLDAFVYEAIINKKYLSQEQLDALAQEPIRLMPWQN